MQRNKVFKLARGKTDGSLETVDAARWKKLQDAAESLRPTLDLPFSKSVAIALAQRLGVHWTTVYRFRQRLILNDEVTSVDGRKRGWKPHTNRITPKQEQAIAEAIATIRRKQSVVRIVDVVDEVKMRCRALRVKAPTRPTIDARIKRKAGLTVMRRGKALSGESDPTISPGSLTVRRPLDLVQMDHTPMDIVVVDDLFRLPLGRPYLTLALDVATRCVLGFVITFIPPSAATVSLCLTQIIASKRSWLKDHGLDGDWSMAGLPKSLHLDNAREFKSKALVRGCAQYGIELIYRPPGRPHFGGHIERLIGTLMSKLQTLPGATGNSTKHRKSRQPEKKAALTLSELEVWFAMEIAAKYHVTEHRGLKGGTPAGTWAMHKISTVAPSNAKRFRIAFLPAVSLALRRDGVKFNHARYWHPIFAQWLVHTDQVIVHYDPSNLSKLYIPFEDDYLDIAYADLRLPAVSLWETEAAAQHLRENGHKTMSEVLLFKAIDQQRNLIRNATQKTRLKTKKQALGRSKIPDPLTDVTPPPKSALDWEKEVVPYPGETW